MKSLSPKIPMLAANDHPVTGPTPEHFAPVMKVLPGVEKKHGLAMFRANPFASDLPDKLRLPESNVVNPGAVVLAPQQNIGPINHTVTGRLFR
jgi:hypothetical protein